MRISGGWLVTSCRKRKIINLILGPLILILITINLELQQTTCQPLRAYSLLQCDSLDHYLNVRWPILDSNNARRTFIEYICLPQDYRVNQYLCSDTPMCYKKQVYFPISLIVTHVLIIVVQDFASL